MLLVLQVCGCKQLQIGESQEVEIGREAAAKLEAEQGVWTDAAQTARVQRIGISIAQRTPRPSLPWSFKITNDRQINAMALPGGFVYVTRGLIESGADDQKLAGVLGHEVAHVTQRHALKMVEKALTGALVVEIVTNNRSSDIQQAADIALQLIVKKGYREEEYDADQVGSKWARGGGYRVEGLLDFLKDLRQLEGRDPSKLETWVSTHPSTASRVTRLEEYLPTLGAAQP
jgi:predicted Zn-dependent protease